jgi:type II secretory pathway predicted ATPase ExeA
MDLGTAGLREQPFPTHGKPLALVAYGSQQEALKAIRDTLEHRTGLSLLQGPALSGKSILIRHFRDSAGEDQSIALINGKGLNTTNLLLEMLRQFGYEIDLSSANELIGLVRVFAMQQAASGAPPIIFIENVHELNPSALRVLCELAQLRIRVGSALKLVLVSNRSLAPIIAAPAMHAIAKRVLHDFHLRPMTALEARDYVHGKLLAAGAERPSSIFPASVCDELWKASGGWPGILDRIALLALARADSLPVSAEFVEHPVLPAGTWDDALLTRLPEETSAPKAAPRLKVTKESSVIHDIAMDKPRLLIGRSEYNDIAISNRFISRHHALLIRQGNTTLLVDLNSTNGTFVNSKRVSNHMLAHDDIVTIGHHHMKFTDPQATQHGRLDGASFDDTAIMKSLQDMRNLLTQENTASLPAVGSEDLPTLG